AALATAECDPETSAVYELRAAIAAYRSSDPAATAAHADRAVSLACEHSNYPIWGEAALLRSPVPPVVPAESEGSLQRFLTDVGERERGLQAQAHARLSEHAFQSLRLAEGRGEAECARVIASELDDHATLARIDFGEGLQRFGNLEFAVALTQLERCAEHA